MGLHRVDYYFGYTFIDYDDDEGGRVAPLYFSLGNFCWPTRKRGVRKKGKMGRKRKIWKGRGGKLKMEWKNGRGKVWRRAEDFFFFFACHFLKPLKFVWGLPKWTIFTKKKHISRREKFGKSDFAPLEKHFSYATALIEHFICEICVSILKITATSGDKLNSQITVNYKLSLLGNNMTACWSEE